MRNYLIRLLRYILSLLEKESIKAHNTACNNYLNTYDHILGKDYFNDPKNVYLFTRLYDIIKVDGKYCLSEMLDNDKKYVPRSIFSAIFNPLYSIKRDCYIKAANHYFLLGILKGKMQCQLIKPIFRSSNICTSFSKLLSACRISFTYNDNFGLFYTYENKELYLNDDISNKVSNKILDTANEINSYIEMKMRYI